MLGVACGVLLNGHQVRHAAAFFKLAAHQMSLAFRCNHHDVNILRRNDIFEVDIKTVTEAECLSRLQNRGDLFLINLRLYFVRHRYDNQSGALAGRFYIRRLETVPLRELEVVCSFQFRYRHLDSAVAQILAVRMSLAAVTDNCYLLAF